MRCASKRSPVGKNTASYCNGNVLRVDVAKLKSRALDSATCCSAPLVLVYLTVCAGKPMVDPVPPESKAQAGVASTSLILVDPSS